LDRNWYYLSEQPTDTIFMTAERAHMIALGYLAQGIIGTATVVDGLGCIPTVPASLAVQILPGSIYQQEPVDTVAYGSLGTDAVDQIIKQGIILPTTSLTLTPPGTSGQAVNYLIQAEVFEQDTNNVVLGYFNSANPLVPFSGPGGFGASQPTIRQCTVSLVAKSGVAATAGTQLTPAPDAGFVGLWVVTVANGATALTSSQISQYPTAPFISVKLPQVPAWVQGGAWDWAVDTGTANQIIVNLTPTPVNIQAGFEIKVQKMASASTGAMTIIVNGAAPLALVAADGSALTSSTPMNGGYLALLVFNGTSYRWVNTTASTAVGSLAASGGEGIQVSGGGVVALNYPGLSVEPVIANTDLWSFYSQGDTHHRVVSWTQFLALISAAIPASLINVQIFSTPGTTTYTPTPRTKTTVFLGCGAGGGGAAGGGLTISINAYGGASGGVFLHFFFNPTAQTVTIGLGGAPGIAPSGSGTAGTATSIGAIAQANGGGAGQTVPSPLVGLGGAATAGTIKLPGNNGRPGISGNIGGWGGDGGPAPFFGVSGQGGVNINSPGGDGSFGGGGGGGTGGQSPRSGGRGGDGFVLALEFI
jgi:hypothetical protein